MKKLILGILAAFVLAASSFAAAPAYPLLGSKVTISVTVDGTPPFTYQWRKNNIEIPGATASTYVIQSVTVTDAGNYSVQVRNAAGSTVSDTAPINIIVPPSNGRTTSVVENPAAP